MSMKLIPTFPTLPVELINHILDLLDAKNILFSFAHVCSRFYTIAHNYNRLSIKFTAESLKVDIQRMCKVMRPENVITLTLNNSSCKSKMIRHFLSSVYIYRLTRLRSLTLCDIEEYDLQTIIKPFMNSTLASLSLNMNQVNILSSDSIVLLSVMVKIPSLRKLILDVDHRISDQISWPNQCSIHELRIQECTYEQLGVILHHSPNLRIFALNDCYMRDIDQIVQRTPDWHLTSFTLSDIRMSFDDLEALVSLFPFLTYLKLTTQVPRSSRFVEGFSQCEHFISKKLPLLEEFNFNIHGSVYEYKNIEAILTPFCTPFWLEQKRWFVTATYNESYQPPKVILHSSSHSSATFPDNLKCHITSYSTATTRNDNPSKICNEWMARFDLFSETCTTPNTFELLDQNLFRNLTRLALDINNQWPAHFFERLSTLMDLSQLNEIWLFEHGGCILQSEIMKNMLEQVSNVCTLGISSNDDFISRLENICSVVSHRIKHFKIRLKHLHWMKLVLTCIKEVSIITFQYCDSSSNSIPDMIKWLTGKRKSFYVNEKCKSIQIKLDESDSELSEVKSNHKRIKLTDDRTNISTLSDLE